MSGQRYTPEFKDEAVRQVIERGYSVADISKRLIKAIHGYKVPRVIYGRPSIVTPNKLQRQFTVEHPDRAWVTDIYQ